MFFNSPKKSNPPDGKDKDSLKFFNQRGDRILRRDLERHINRIPFQSYEREYIKAVMAKFDTPYEPASKRYITKEEFLQGLDEMAQNSKDSISVGEVERIKKYFSK